MARDRIFGNQGLLCRSPRMSQIPCITISRSIGSLVRLLVCFESAPSLNTIFGCNQFYAGETKKRVTIQMKYNELIVQYVNQDTSTMSACSNASSALRTAGDRWMCQDPTMGDISQDSAVSACNHSQVPQLHSHVVIVPQTIKGQCRLRSAAAHPWLLGICAWQ